MNGAVRDCLVSDYESLVGSLTLPDPDDRHVLAAAIRVGADAILTFNLKDFPPEELERFKLKAIHPDNFLVGLFEDAPVPVCAAVKRQRAALRNPPKTVEELLAIFAAQGLSRFVAELRNLSGDL